MIGLSACSPKKIIEDYTVESVKVNKLNDTYHTSDTVNFADITVDVIFKNGSKLTLTHGEFDIEKENAKEGTEFILTTDGLYTQIAGELEEDEYTISVYITAYAYTKENYKTVTVTSNLSTKYNLIYFTEPEFKTTYDANVESAAAEKGSDEFESSFYKPADYYVGDDNEFRFQPTITIRNKTTRQNVVLENFRVVVKVNGEEIVEGQQYDLFKYENFKFYFKDGTEWTDENNTFTISMTPADFETDFAGNAIEPVTMTIKVADGYNVYDAVDLGRLSLVSDAFKAAYQNNDVYDRVVSGNVFFNPNGGFKTVTYYQLWQDFLTSKGKTNLKPVNGMFIHNDITINPLTDIPQEYLISIAEAKEFTDSSNPEDYEYLVNSFRDEGWLYPHYMENNITFNGNMFKLDFSNIKWCLSNSDGSTGDRFYYSKDQSAYFMSHAVLFGFLGKVDNTSTQIATFKNVEGMGNSKNVTMKTDKEANEASGAFIYLKADASEVNVDNCIAKAFMIAFYSEYNTKKYSEGENPTIIANNGLNVSYSKIYDCYNSGLFSYWGENNTLTNSDLKRFGGPAIFLINGTADDLTKEGGAEWTVDSNTVIESYISGDEAWFALNGATAKAQEIIALSNVLYQQTDRYFAIDEKINMKSVALESAYLGSDENILYNYFKYGNSEFALNMGNPTVDEQVQAGTVIYTLASLAQKNPADWTQDDFNAYNEAMAFGLDNAKNVFIQVITNGILGKGSPVFMSDGGTMAHIDEYYVLHFVDIDSTIEKFITEMMTKMQYPSYEPDFTPVYDTECHTFEGNLLYFIAPAGNTTLVAVVDLYTKEA